jgi:hypothetical protein
MLKKYLVILNHSRGVNIMGKRTETIKFGEFMNGEYKHKAEQKKRQGRAVLKAVTTGSIIVTASKVAIPAFMVSIPIMLATKPLFVEAVPAAAAVPVAGVISETVKAKIVHAFDPLVDLMVSLSLPIAGVMLTGGALMIMVHQKEMGYKMIMNGCIGYILVQMSPMFLNLLAGVGAAL